MTPSIKLDVYWTDRCDQRYLKDVRGLSAADVEDELRPMNATFEARFRPFHID